MAAKSFRHAARTRDFCVSAEIFLKTESNAATIAAQADLLRECVDGVLVTDNQFGQLHMSTLAAAALLIDNGIDPIMQLSCRNRNRIALLGDLLGAAALGVTSLMLVRGNHVPDGFDPRPKAVMDLDASELIATVARMKSDEQGPALPDFYVGGVVTPHAPEPDWNPRKIVRKIEAGVQFMITNVCMDMEMLRRWAAHLADEKIFRRIDVIASIAIPGSADDARWLCANRPTFRIPDDVIRRLDEARDPEQEAVDLAAGMLAEVAAIPGLTGAHLIATRNLATIPAALAAAGLGPGTA